jgi:starch synthase (maltosyl-transferring)
MPLPKSAEPPRRILIQDVRPQVDCGRYAVKRIVGEPVAVSATIIRDGHEVLGAAVRYKAPGAARWKETLLHPVGNDRFEGSFEPQASGRWSFRIEAWVDRIASYQWEVRRKVESGQEDLSSELAEGAALLERETLTA